MKLINCYIENFGKLHKFTYDFKNGLNLINQENGWGKTTFAAFIKAMFYGLEYTRGKKLTDRKLYKPWNGNRFGGFIVFEKDGTKYKIERFFGRTSKYDTVKVYNMSKNIETDELGDNPGEKIWGIDRDSYEKTAFISLDDSGLLNDIISSKLGDIEDREADMETSSKAIDLIDKEMTRIKAKRGSSGLIGTKEEDLDKLRGELAEYRNSLNKIEKVEYWIKEEEGELKQTRSQIEKIEKEQSKLLLYEKKEQYKSIIDEFEDKQEKYNENKSFFKENTLTEKELKTIRDKSSKYINQKEELDKAKLSDGEKKEIEELEYRFRKNLPKTIEIDEYNRKSRQLSNKEVELEKYSISGEEKNRFKVLDEKYKDIKADVNTIEGYLSDFENVSKLTEEENKMKSEIERLKQESIYENTSKSKKSPLFYIGLILAIMGILSISISLVSGIILAGIGIVAVIISMKKDSANKDRTNDLDAKDKIENLNTSLEEIKAKKDDLSKGYNGFIEMINESPSNIASFLTESKFKIEEYNNLKDRIEKNLDKSNKISNEILTLREEIENYLKNYSNLIDSNNYDQALSNLKNDLYRYQELSKKEKSYIEKNGEIEKLQETLRDRLGKYYDEFTDDINNTVQDLTDKYYELEKSKDRLDDAKDKKEKFETDNDIEKLSKINLEDRPKDQGIEEFKASKKALNEIKEEHLRKIEGYKKDSIGLIKEADKIEDTESEIEKIEIDIENLKKEHELLDITKTCLIEAKEDLAQRYMGDMTSNFQKYLDKLNNNNLEKYQVDINLNIKVECDGKLHEGNRLSSGMKDLVQLCLRMALVESIYKDVKNPILVLDDPFINLDDVRLENAIDLLKKTSQEYQIVYFVCHGSRSI